MPYDHRLVLRPNETDKNEDLLFDMTDVALFHMSRGSMSVAYFEKCVKKSVM